jgi:23S rRNA (guanine745-N1)-methyltransferase
MFAVFSPIGIDEADRVLKDDGKLILVGPGENHLKGLLALMYEKINPHSGNFKDIDESDKFNCIESIEIKENIKIENKHILDFLRMTPYYWQVKEEIKETILGLEYLERPIHFYLKVYRKSK